jgi:phage terminase large subunit
MPRTPYHLEIHRGMDAHRFGTIVTHRRFGKTVLSLNHLILACLENKRRSPEPEPRYAFIQPFQGQVKLTAWDYLVRFTSTIPGAIPMVSELKVTLPHGGWVRLFGADNPQAFRGGYFDGVVLDEYAKMAPYLFSEVIRPTLVDYRGWCYFLDTPKGRNDFYRKCEQARTDEDWFYAMHKASETKIVSDDELAAARKDMTPDEYLQEFECSFEASIKGAVFAKELQAIREQGRITRVPFDPALPVDTDWDLGVGDATAIWFSQSLSTGEVRIIDYYENNGVGLPHYLGLLNEKRESLGYVYGTHWAPHDIEVKELGTGLSRRETAFNLGLNFQVTPKRAIDDGIHAARMLLPRCYFDEKAQKGIEALQSYRWDYNTRINEFKPMPVHDWASHAADAFRGLAVRHVTPQQKRLAKQVEKSVEADVREYMKQGNFGAPVASRTRAAGRGGY